MSIIYLGRGPAYLLHHLVSSVSVRYSTDDLFKVFDILLMCRR